jgi:D-alanyl-D-alanine carboxypeptidase
MTALLVVFGIVAIVIISLIALFAIYVAPYLPENDSASYIAEFIKKNPDKSSIYLAGNGQVLADFNSDKPFPLASTVKTIIAIEYAKQVGQGKINPNEEISLAELEKFYVGRDGNAHPDWIKSFTEKGWIKNDKTTIENVAKGMIWFSSNANTEYLLQRLGVENVNQNLTELGLSKHQKLYYFVSSMLLEKEFSRSEIEKMSLEDYIKNSADIHEKLKNNQIDKSQPNYFSGLYRVMTGGDKIWSDRLSAATTKEYYSIVKKMNDRNYFDEKTQTALDNVMQGAMQKPENQETFQYMGGKGGSTAYILTKTLYATDKNGNKTEMCIFFNDLSFFENIFLQEKLNEFQKLILTDENFRNQVLEMLK